MQTMEVASASASLKGCAEEWLSRLATTPTGGGQQQQQQQQQQQRQEYLLTSWPTMQLGMLEATLQLCQLLSAAVYAGRVQLCPQVASGALSGIMRELEHRKV